jgi:hypothetical protein
MHGIPAGFIFSSSSAQVFKHGTATVRRLAKNPGNAMLFLRRQHSLRLSPGIFARGTWPGDVAQFAKERRSLA